MSLGWAPPPTNGLFFPVRKHVFLFFVQSDRNVTCNNNKIRMALPQFFPEEQCCL